MTAPTRCQHEGCQEAGLSCRIVIDEGDLPWEFYCPAHAAEHGYCAACGEFWAGIDSFEFLHPGFCNQCADHVLDDDDEVSWMDDIEEDWGL